MENIRLALVSLLLVSGKMHVRFDARFDRFVHVHVYNMFFLCYIISIGGQTRQRIDDNC